MKPKKSFSRESTRTYLTRILLVPNYVHEYSEKILASDKIDLQRVLASGGNE